MDCRKINDMPFYLQSGVGRNKSLYISTSFELQSVYVRIVRWISRALSFDLPVAAILECLILNDLDPITIGV